MFRFRSGFLLLALGIISGLALFGIIFLSKHDDDFYTPEPLVTTATGEPVKPLPNPLPAGESLPTAADALPDTGELVLPPGDTQASVGATPPPEPIPELPPPPAYNPNLRASPEPVVTQPPPVQQNTERPLNSAPTPLPEFSPQPIYPREALRRGESGTVVLNVQIDIYGVPTRISVSRRSGSRALDRAAQEAVRNWRFDPAIQNGQPINSALEIPIVFNHTN